MRRSNLFIPAAVVAVVLAGTLPAAAQASKAPKAKATPKAAAVAKAAVAPPAAWAVTNASAAWQSAIELGMGTIKGKDGSGLLQVVVDVQGPSDAASLPTDDILLAAGAVEAHLVAVGVVGNSGACSWEPVEMMQSGFAQAELANGEGFKVGRKDTTVPKSLTLLKRHTRLCTAFSLPTTQAGALTLQFGDARLPVAAK